MLPLSGKPMTRSLSGKEKLHSVLCSNTSSIANSEIWIGQKFGYVPIQEQPDKHFKSKTVSQTTTVETQYNEILGTGKFVCYIRYFVTAVFNKQYKTKQINSLGPEKIVCYIRYFVILDLFISSFHCTHKQNWR